VTEVLLFARARELAGTRRIELSGATVTDVVRAAAERFGEEFAELCTTCTVVVDGETVPRSLFDTTAPGAELAILPPVSGGAHDDADPQLPVRVVVVTVSDRASSGVYEDLTGPAIEELLRAHGDGEGAGAMEVVGRELVSDEADRIAEVLRRWCDGGGCDLVLTNGGTGLSPRDVTPEATRSVLDAEAPGLGELMRASGLTHTPLAALSRQAAGRRGHTLVVNLPGSVRGATESLAAVLAVLSHAVAMARVGAR
jgi:molybdenum cofactor synthesis domain-containing protein